MKKNKRGNKTGTKKSQGFKNTKAYKVRYKQDKIDLQKNAVLDRVCKRCYEQLQWKLQYGKYKPIKHPKKCQNCGSKAILKPYRLLCNKCGDDLKKCTKCMGEGTYCKESFKHAPKAVRQRKLALAENELKKMTLRCKHRIVRLWEDEKVAFRNGIFCYIENGEPVENLTYKKKFQVREEEADDEEYDEIFGDLEGIEKKDDLNAQLKQPAIGNFVQEGGNAGIKISF